MSFENTRKDYLLLKSTVWGERSIFWGYHGVFISQDLSRLEAMYIYGIHSFISTHSSCSCSLHSHKTYLLDLLPTLPPMAPCQPM
jgi:hypothetical protein